MFRIVRVGLELAWSETPPRRGHVVAEELCSARARAPRNCDDRQEQFRRGFCCQGSLCDAGPGS